MTLLDVFIPFKPFPAHSEDWSHCMIEQFELNDLAGCVHSIQTISFTEGRLELCYS
jgi:hypothetical protein